MFIYDLSYLWLSYYPSFFSYLQLDEKDVYLSYLPLAHIFDRIVEEAMIWHGASIGFWRGVSISFITKWRLDVNIVLWIWFDLKKSQSLCLMIIRTLFMQWLQDVKLLMEDLGELKPTIFVAVPRVLDRVYTGSRLFCRCWQFSDVDDHHILISGRTKLLIKLFLSHWSGRFLKFLFSYPFLRIVSPLLTNNNNINYHNALIKKSQSPSDIQVWHKRFLRGAS